MKYTLRMTVGIFVYVFLPYVTADFINEIFENCKPICESAGKAASHFLGNVLGSAYAYGYMPKDIRSGMTPIKRNTPIIREFRYVDEEKGDTDLDEEYVCISCYGKRKGKSTLTASLKRMCNYAGIIQKTRCCLEHRNDKNGAVTMQRRFSRYLSTCFVKSDARNNNIQRKTVAKSE